MKKALITGITGQDGSYLAELLLFKNYEVHDVIRRSSSFNTGRIDHLYNNDALKEKNLFLHHGDITDSSNINRILEIVQPNEIYNLAAQSHVMVSFEMPDYTSQVDAIGTLRLLDAIKKYKSESIKFYQASTSELFGKVQEIPQTEKTPFYPRSPYAVAKMYSYWIVVNYREAYDIKAFNGILFNHESPRRGETFVTRKITMAVAKIGFGLQEKVYLGNLDSKRDWGHAKDYVEAMYQMMQLDNADDFVIATGKTNSVRDFVFKAFTQVGITLEFFNSGLHEKGVVKNIDYDIFKNYFNNTNIKVGQILVEVAPVYFRPTEVDILVGDSSKALKNFNWKPKYELDDLIKEMIESDIKLFRNENYLKKAGFKI